MSVLLIDGFYIPRRWSPQIASFHESFMKALVFLINGGDLMFIEMNKGLWVSADYQTDGNCDNK